MSVCIYNYMSIYLCICLISIYLSRGLHFTLIWLAAICTWKNLKIHSPLPYHPVSNVVAFGEIWWYSKHYGLECDLRESLPLWIQHWFLEQVLRRCPGFCAELASRRRRNDGSGKGGAAFSDEHTCSRLHGDSTWAGKALSSLSALPQPSSKRHVTTKQRFWALWGTVSIRNENNPATRRERMALWCAENIMNQELQDMRSSLGFFFFFL